MIETCQQYVDRRLFEGWKIVGRFGHSVYLSPPDGSFIRPVDLRNDVETLRPNAAGDDTELSKWGDTFNWQCVDEEIPDDDTTYVVAGWNEPNYLRDFYNLPASEGSGDINHVTVYALCKAAGTPTQASIKICVKSDSTPTEDAEKTITTDYVSYSKQWATNPADSQAWEWSDIDALQIGISMRQSAVNKGTLCTQVYVEIDYTAVTTAYKDIVTRFRLRVQGFTDAATRLRLGVLGYKDTATRFLLTVGVQAYKDTATRFKLWAQTYKDTATRFKLTLLAYKDTATRFRLWVQVYNDIATRFRLRVLNYQDIATRFQLTVRAFIDTASRFRLIVQNYRDAATRFRLWVEAYRDTATRFILNILNYQDIATRFKLTVRAYQDTATRFKLIAQRYTNIATRFRLSIQTYQDVSTRFFLYQPTWEEIQIQQAVTALEAEIEGLELEPVAHFRI